MTSLLVCFTSFCVLAFLICVLPDKLVFSFKIPTECLHIINSTRVSHTFIQSKEDGKDQASIQSSTTSYRGTKWDSDKKNKKTPHMREPRGQPFPAGDHKAARNRYDSITKTSTNNEKDPQKKHRLRTVCKIYRMA